jgi:dipeptidyl aminopeptidase/acylaminoacyl peptidase
MTRTTPNHPRPGPLACALGLAAVMALLYPSAVPAESERAAGANYRQALNYSAAHLGQFTYDTSVVPNWIGQTDSFWYHYKTSQGTSYYRVNARLATKEPLFDHVKLCTLLSEATQKPLEAAQLPLTRVSLNSEGTTLRFVTDEMQYEYDLKAEKLSKLGKASPAPAFGPGAGGRGGFRRGGGQQQEQQQQQRDGQVRGGRRGFGPGGPGNARDYRVFSPDRKAYLFVRDHNLYLLESGDKAPDTQGLPVWQSGFGGALINAWRATRGAAMLREAGATRLTTDGAEDYDFGRMGIFGAGMDDGIPPPQAVWSSDSKSFYATRIDARAVQDLYLVNAIATPRPTLEKYKYPMPGEDAARKMELFVCDRVSRKLVRVPPKWKDEAYSDIHWGKTTDEVRFLRRDRLWRHAELCTVNVRTAACKCLILEGFEGANVTSLPVQYVEGTDEMIWWSERSGWGHFYLYDRDGKLKNAITSGLFRASRIVAVDAKNRLLYFQGNGREPGESVYHQHLYCVHLDGTGLTLLDPGDANHQSVLSPSRQFVVDNFSRVDLAPVAVLRDATGREVLKLAQMDLSRLKEIGWKMPECFTVKAADGVTDLCGNLWKPFDFDPKKRYPIIVHCYPGPQQEGVTHNFTASSGEQQLAQLGFIVIQVGHRGGAPTRSKAYASFGYENLRDYGLADKKGAVEQLAARCPFIDVQRVGIYGHSGGGFMSAAALLQKPYNEFFKAAVASSGNHDNNIYNNGWAERYHGMREVAVQKGDAKAAEGQSKTADGGRRDGSRAGQDQDTQGGDDRGDGQERGRVEQQTQGKTDAVKEGSSATRFEIKVPTNAELAANLKGHLLLVHGDMDNNVHPANTMRLVDALIKANKRFDMLILPGKRHAYGDYQPYFTQRMWDFFADHLLGDRQAGADIYEKRD